MKPLTVQEIREAAAGSLLSGAEDLLVTGVEMDSRIMKPGDCFFALSGERSDGNDYIKAAFSGGAVCAVVTDPARAEEAAKAFPGRAVIVVKEISDSKSGRDRKQWENNDKGYAACGPESKI